MRRLVWELALGLGIVDGGDIAKERPTRAITTVEILLRVSAVFARDLLV